jgi:hypothetical protein
MGCDFPEKFSKKFLPKCIVLVVYKYIPYPAELATPEVSKFSESNHDVQSAIWDPRSNEAAMSRRTTYNVTEHSQA